MVAHDLLVCDQFTVQLRKRADNPIRRAWRDVVPRLFTPRKTDFRRRGMLLLSSPLRTGQFRLIDTVFHGGHVNRYRLSRMFLGIGQVVGWVVGIVAAVLGLSSGAVGFVLLGIFSAVLNHAVMAVGLAVLDIADAQQDELAANHDQRNLLREILGVLKVQNRKIDEQAAPVPAPRPPQPRVEVPVKIPKDGTTLLEPAPAAQAEAPDFKPLVVSGDVPPSKPLDEADIKRLEAEQRKRGKS